MVIMNDKRAEEAGLVIGQFYRTSRSLGGLPPVIPILLFLPPEPVLLPVKAPPVLRR